MLLLHTLLTTLLAATPTLASPITGLTTSRDAAVPSLDEFLSSPMTFEKRQSNTSLPSAPVQLCTQPSFSGQCTNATWPVNECIDLRGYAGLTESFLPADGFECLVMQGECDANKPFAEVGNEDVAEGGDLTTYKWIGEASSYMCFTEIESLRRFVRISRLRVPTRATV
ncbi:hypothetical protein PRZ48_003580 [Zasmidium cellare]|uniref:Uncharacterized protein n=1 Tax=Zasmidium cellare TaxID=395010 RepID=A0ABR0EVH7_ZASCE|nr:hypothetical protein PRZ48_003580 [Zasmidium cellare]